MTKCVAFLIQTLAKLFVLFHTPVDILYASLAIILLALTGAIKAENRKANNFPLLLFAFPMSPIIEQRKCFLVTDCLQ